MKYLIRMLNKPTRWSFISPDSDENFPAEPLGDIATDKNTLSFYEVDEKKDSLENVILGLATNRKSIDKIEYVKISSEEIRRVGFKIEKTSATTPCYDANALHVNAVEIKANQLVQLAKVIYFSMPDSVKQVSASKVRRLISSAVKDGKLNIDQLDFSEETKRKIGIL